MTTVVTSLPMDQKKNKWQWQCWKTCPIWDPVLLPRPFPISCIKSMKCYLSTFIFILSQDSNVEIWNSSLGQVVFHYDFTVNINKIDFFDMYCKEIKQVEDIKNWNIIIANKDGNILSCKGDSTESIKSSEIYMKNLKKCFYKVINESHTVVLIGTELLIIINEDFTIINCLTIQKNENINCSLILNDDAVLSSFEKLYIFNEILEVKLVQNQNHVKDYHKLPVIKLIAIDSTYMASISMDKIVILKKPLFNLTRVFMLNVDAISDVEKSMTYLVHNSRYLVIGFNLGLTIFDCTTGSCIAEIQYASESQIIKIVHLNWLSMILTVSKESRLRYWAFQVTDNDLSKTPSSPLFSKSMSFSVFSRQTSTKEQNSLSFLGKSFEKDKEKCQLNCFLELENSVKSKNHFINLEEIGMLTNDGSQNLLLWRNREYTFSSLIHLLQ